MESVFLEDFKDISDIKRNFELKDKDLKGVKILLAYYAVECYEGDAFVLFEKRGKLYEVNGSHCSCYGLEGQWEPELTSREAICHRMSEGTLGLDYRKNDTFRKKLIEVLFIGSEGKTIV